MLARDYSFHILKPALKYQRMQDAQSEQWGFSQLRKLSLFFFCSVMPGKDKIGHHH